MRKRAPTCAASLARIAASVCCTGHLATVMTPIPVPDPDPRPMPPEEPGPNECCGSGCPLCVLDLYADELARYRQALAEWRQRHPQAED